MNLFPRLGSRKVALTASFVGIELAQRVSVNGWVKDLALESAFDPLRTLGFSGTVRS